MLTKFKKLITQNNEKKLDFKYEINNNKLIIDFNFYLYKYDLYWKKVSLKFINKSNVKLNIPVNWKKIIKEKSFIINWSSKRIILNLKGL